MEIIELRAERVVTIMYTHSMVCSLTASHFELYDTQKRQVALPVLPQTELAWATETGHEPKLPLQILYMILRDCNDSVCRTAGSPATWDTIAVLKKGCLIFRVKGAVPHCTIWCIQGHWDHQQSNMTFCIHCIVY